MSILNTLEEKSIKFSYYPGCTLKTRAVELDRSARLAAGALGVEMEELPEWQCCGAVYPLGRDEIATKLSAVRALDSAKTLKQPLLTLCSACHHVIKRVNNDMQTDEETRAKVNNYMKLSSPYAGETAVVHYLEMLRDAVGFDALREKVSAPLSGKKIAAYYGCMLLRPGAVMQFDNPENPSIMEDFIAAVGATPVYYPYRNECCGGYLMVEEPRIVKDMSKRIMRSAAERAADLIITACPLCMYNLNENGTVEVPVHY
ncbi:MAG: CoB--CoM heterodisulfide reductase iron-sulfur subunit B family protein, partial [Synergistaceae bacterium]|nr:CoB--CoM heterodisulfide reductase iron-sulfur subunit B family protein [Synergistaceae bacterium]